MSDNIPLEIQQEIIIKVSNVKSLIQFRSVSKSWKSLIDTSEFIKSYGARHTNPHSHILCSSSRARFIYLVEEDNDETFFKVHQQELAPFVISPLLKQYYVSKKVIGTCRGLVCLYGFQNVYNKWMLVIWNPSIGKSVGVVDPLMFGATHYGFGVCPVTKDPTIVKIKHTVDMPRHVEVFTLSSRVWNVIPSSNMLSESVRLFLETHVVIDRFIYWGACDRTSAATTKYLVVSFDLITKEFKAVDLPDSITRGLYGSVSVFVSKLRESLVVYVNGATCCDVWVMEHDSSFKKLFTISARVGKILGFKKSGEAILEIWGTDYMFATLNVYDPCSQQIKNLGISGEYGSMFMGSYKESLLLLDHSDSHVYSDDS